MQNHISFDLKHTMIISYFGNFWVTKPGQLHSVALRWGGTGARLLKALFLSGGRSSPGTAFVMHKFVPDLILSSELRWLRTQ